MRRTSALVAFACAVSTPLAAAPPPGWCGTGDRTAMESLWLHQEERARRGPVRASEVRAAAERVGEIAVLRDEGDLALFRKDFDLQGVGVTISPQDGTYVVTRTDRAVAGGTGTRLGLGDDDTTVVPLPFAFPFHGRTWNEVHVNSDGNLTFGQGDGASTARDIGRLVNGPPRIAPLLADLDPSAAGSVTHAGDGARFTVTWTQVPQFGVGDANTFEVTLRADGAIEFAYASTMATSLSTAATGVAPGEALNGVTPVDFSNPGGAVSAGALAETFRDTDELDTAAVARKFYAAHPDEYMQLVVFTSRRMAGSGTFAFEQTVKNEIGGIGSAAFDYSGEFGSGGRLESFLLMDTISKYPDDFASRLLGDQSALSILAHETGHRWLALARFEEAGRVSGELLGRQNAHWSFFMDANGSHLEGNEISDLGGGQFRTGVDHSARYGELDQYLMGLRRPDEVPPFFFVRSPTGVVGTTAATAPGAGVTFGGTRVDVGIGQVIAALGERTPPAGEAPVSHRQAWVYVAIGVEPDAAQIAKIDRLRQLFPDYYARSTDGRASVSVTLE